MSATPVREAAVVFSLLIGWGLQANGQDLNWAQKMFDKQSHDFGVVARGADVTHRFKVKNIYKENIHIQNVTTTCGCSDAKISKNLLATGEEAYLEVSMDTQRFMRKKSSGVVVTFDSPQFIEVRLPLEVYIRTDVVLTPGSVSFGAVEKGTKAERKLEIAYAGRPDWKINKVKTNNKHVSALVKQRMRANGRVAYDLHVTLDKDAPAGNIRDQIIMVTDDANSPFVPVLVTARIEADITVTPSQLTFGRMNPGQSKVINVVLRGKQPFVIDKIECESDKQSFRFRPTEGEKRVHVVPLTFISPDQLGKFSELFTVTIAGRKDPITFHANAEIIAAAN